MISFEMTPGTVVLSLSGFLVTLWAAIWAGVKYFTKKRLDHEFNKRLENHKSELQNIRDYNNFDLGRRMQDFNLFTTKKHSIYPDLYKSFLIAEGKIGLFYSGIIRSVPDFLRMSGEQLEKYLRDRFDTTDSGINLIISNWDKRKRDLIGELQTIIRTKEINEAHEAITEAKNQFLFSRLYISDELADILESLTRLMHSYLIDKEYILYDEGPEMVRMATSLKSMQDRISELMTSAKKTMQIELKIGYYDSSSI